MQTPFRNKVKAVLCVGLTVVLLLGGAGVSHDLLAQEKTATLAAVGAEPFDGGEDIEELQCNMYKQSVRFTSPPAQGMTFTAGTPIRVFGSSYFGSVKVECFMDGKSYGVVTGRDDLKDYFEFFVKDVPVGRHIIVLKATYPQGNGNETPPLAVLVEAPPARAHTVRLAEDLVLKGGQDLKWEDATVMGNGFRVRSEQGWTGSVIIRNARVSGLGSVSAPGIDVSTTGGAILVRDTVFEGCGTILLATAGNGDFVLRNNEFRANNVIRFIPAEPRYSPMLVLKGNPSGKKLFQGNRMGIGWVAFEGATGWLIGGDTDDDANVLLGQRTGIRLLGCRNCVIRGNYCLQKCGSGWSQSTILYFDRSNDILCEHNIVSESAWPVQAFDGEFRYNAVVLSGHQWMRTVMTGTRIHHNLFLNGAPSYTGGILVYDGRKDLAVYNNTFDGGAPRQLKQSPIATSPVLLAYSKGDGFSSVRNNVFMGNIHMGSGTPPSIVTAPPGGVGYADYNCFFNPLAPKMPAYAERAVAGKAGEHDVHADPGFAAGLKVPPPVKPGQLWNRKAKFSQVLAYYRARYRPAPGSPLLGAGDPADGKDSYIGAIGPGKDAPDDLFGRFGAAANAEGEK